MYQHKIPIHLDIEDTFILGLTTRQCIMLGAGATIAWVTFIDVGNALPPTVGYLVLAALCGALVMAAITILTFYRVASRGLEEWALIGLLYAIAPTFYLWSFNHDELYEDAHETTLLEAQEHEDEW